MNSLISVEIYKFRKAGTYKFSLILSMLPILFFIYLLQGKLILIETGYSMNQWCAILLFQLSEQFLIPAILLSMIYDIVLKEKDIGYKNMLIVREKELKILIAKLIPSIIYSVITILITIGIISLGYTLFSSYTSYFTGKIVNNEANIEYVVFQLNILFIITYGIFLPLITIILSSYLSTGSVLTLVIIGLLAGRLFSQIEIFNRYTIWFYFKQAKYIISIDDFGLIWKPYISMIAVFGATLALSLIKKTNRLKLGG